jgi:transcriptional regulator with XRE-family HTH domain
MGALTDILAIRIRLLRRDRGWSQEELAERSRISARYIGQLERHHASPSVDVLEQIANAFSVSPAELLKPIPRKPKML